MFKFTCEDCGRSDNIIGQTCVHSNIEVNVKPDGTIKSLHDDYVVNHEAPKGYVLVPLDNAERPDDFRCGHCGSREILEEEK